MPRLAIAYVLSGRAGEVANALRRCYDAEGAVLLPAHVTLSGIGRGEHDPGPARDAMREAASLTEHFEITVGPAATFLPVTAVAYLQINPIEPLTALHDLLQERLGWEEAFPFVPHVTITAFLPSDETARIVAELQKEAVSETDVLSSLTLFEERAPERWVSVWTEELGGT